MTTPHTNPRPECISAPRRELTLFDSACIIVGIIIGSGIYETTPLIAQNVPGVGWLLAVWLLGGLLSLVGGLCYAELATAYPKEGGDYVYLTRAFGRMPGFLFAWSQLWVVRPGSIGAMAYVFGRYANQLWPLGGAESDHLARMAYAAAAVTLLSAVNVLGVREGKWTQNLLTTIKVVGLLVVCVAGFWFGSTDPLRPPVAAEGPGTAGLALAMILVLYTYGGWNEMAYVGAEVCRPEKNILRALLLGIVGVTAIYLAVTGAFLWALGFSGTAASGAVAADVLRQAVGPWGARLISLLICLSALGAINGQIFTGARIYYAMGTEHRLFARLGQWNRWFGTPAWSLAMQAGITLALVIGFGLWAEGAFQAMVEFTTPIFWGFFLLVGVSLFVLRRREPDVPRPYRVPLYPLTPAVFCLSSLTMLYASIRYAIEQSSFEAAWAVGLLLIGAVFALFDRRSDSKRQA